MTIDGVPGTAERPGLLDLSCPVVLFADEWGGIGGTAGYVLMLARSLARRGYRVGTICHDVPAMEPVMEALEAAGSDVLRLPQGGPRIQQRELARLLEPYRRGVLALMMGYHSRGGGVALAARRARMTVIRADLTPPEPPFARFEGRKLRAKDLLVDAVVVGAKENRVAFREQLGRRRKTYVINTGIELDRFTPGEGREEARARFGLGADDVVVGTLCRLSDRRKGVHDFVEMAARVSKRFPGTRFLIVGEGVLRPDLERQAADFGLADAFVFAGWNSNPAPSYAAMDIFVMASTHEGGPTTLLEAMAMARPVVATAVGMVPEVVEDGVTGFICPHSSPDALATAVETLLGDGELATRMGTTAREQALAHFSIERMVDRYLRLFAIASGRQPGG